MIHLLTITPNPAIDLVIEVPRLEWAETLFATSERRAAGGKGVNMSRVAVAMGDRSTAVFLAGGENGGFIADELAMAGIDPIAVESKNPTRTNMVFHAPDKRSLKVNMPGQPITREEAESFVAEVARNIDGKSAIAIAGSMPRGMPSELMIQLFEAIGAKSIPLHADLQGDWLKLACRYARPVLVKPNVKELSDIVGRSLQGQAEIIAAARELVAMGVRRVAVTDGPRPALLVSANDCYSARPAPTSSRTMAGMGDAFGVGYLTALLDGESPEERLAQATAYGGAVAAAPEADLINPNVVELTKRAVQVERLAEP